MPRPAVSDAAEVLYEALDPAFTTGDEARGWTALLFCRALTSGALSDVFDWVTDGDDGTPGWQIILNPALAPAIVLPYLAQFAGGRLTPNMSVDQQRNAIQDPEVFSRCTPDQLAAVVKRRLTGTKAVIITERYLDLPWRLRVETLDAETPDPDLTIAEIKREAKHVGIVLFFNTRSPWTYGEILAESGTYPDYTALDAAFDTYFELRTFEP